MRTKHRTAGSIGKTNRVHDHPLFIPSIPMDDILRELIVTELRSGRMTPARRQDVSRYALQFGLSLAQTDSLIAEVERDIALDDETPKPPTRRVVRDRRRNPLVRPVAYIIAGAFLIVLDVVIVALT